MCKKIVLLMILFVFILFLNGCSKNDEINDKIVISATFYPLAEFSKQVGGDLIKVNQIIPDGAEPHDYELVAKDLVEIYKSDILIVNGADLEPWVIKIKKEAEEKNVQIITMSDYINLLSSNDDNVDHSENFKNIDPHFWLDPNNAIKEVEIINKILGESDPDNKYFYEENAKKYIEKLSELNLEFEDGLKNCGKSEIITSHSAFAYMGARYGFVQYGISGLSPQEEPNSKKIATLSNLAKEKDIKYIFFETLVSPKLSDTLAKEVGARTLLLHPIGGLTQNDIQNKNDYLSLMRANLNNLKIALECQ